MKTYNILSIFGLKHAVILILMLSTLQLFSQTISTSQGTFVLLPPSDLVNASSARSAKRVAELAISAVTSDSEKLIAEKKTMQNEIDDYLDDKTRYDTDLAAYNKKLSTYDANLRRYDDQLALYDKDLEPHDAAVEAYNALAPENKDTGTYNQLMDSKNRLDNLLAGLDAEKAILDEELSILNNDKTTLDMSYNSLNSRYSQLNAADNAIKIKLRAAYRQLDQLYKYSIEINKLLEKWEEPIINTYNLNTPLEQLKSLSNKGWDN